MLNDFSASFPVVEFNAPPSTPSTTFKLDGKETERFLTEILGAEISSEALNKFASLNLYVKFYSVVSNLVRMPPSEFLSYEKKSDLAEILTDKSVPRALFKLAHHVRYYFYLNDNRRRKTFQN